MLPNLPCEQTDAVTKMEPHSNATPILKRRHVMCCMPYNIAQKTLYMPHFFKAGDLDCAKPYAYVLYKNVKQVVMNSNSQSLFGL